MKAAACAVFMLSAVLAAPAQAAVASRSVSYVYDPATGLLAKEIAAPNDSNLCLVKEYTYDAYGNQTSVATRNCNGSAGEAAAPAAGTPAVISTRTSTTAYTYNADGSVMVVAANAVGHTETRVSDPAFGKLISLTGPNNLTTTWTYDTFGRQTLETRADGTTTTTAYSQPCGMANADLTSAAYCASSQKSGDSNANYAYYDALNRKLAAVRIDFTNTQWITDGRVDYDATGQIAKSYLSYPMGGAASAKFSTFYRDILGRITSEVAPDNSTSYVSYNGLFTTDTNALRQTKVTVRSVIGQIVSITDAQNKTIGYTYDPFGNLLTTTDALGNVTTLTYDAMGHRIGMTDPDMGLWQYFYDVLGEVVIQTDAKGQTVTMAYDVLGRMVSKSEPDLVSTWVYDTAANGKGKLASTGSNNGYSRTFTYDSLGREASVSSIIDNPAVPYVEGTTYDTYSRIATRTYPDGFAVKNVYNAAGYLAQIVHAATPTTVYWTANAMDASGHITQQTYGNGVVWNQTYDAATGRITLQQAGVNNAVQNMAYSYDSLGNLMGRNDVIAGLSESFNYDSLNRITSAMATSATANTLTSFAYDAIGNVTTKSDVGSYTYNASGANSIRPHAVASITGSVYGVTNPVYTYDANGNMLNGAGRTIVWTSYNMPSQMTGCPAGGTTCSTVGFWYNSDHERIKELQADQSVVITLSPRYDTGLHFEKKYVTDQVTHLPTGVIEYEHYLYAGGQMFGKYVVTTATDGVTVATTQNEYYIKDHLGSIVARLDGTGTVLERLSYDAFGKRRNTDGSAATIVNPDMYHGYTGHEMLDAVGLIHMNGRVFDPQIARFMSADPTIQSPRNMQSYNRYTYGWNNPLAGTDPSGYSWLGERFHALTGKDWSKVRDKYVKPIAIAVVSYYTAGAISGWLYGEMAAASGITATAGEIAANHIVAQALGTAMTQYLANAGTVLANGGNLQQAIHAGEQGAVNGLIGGVVSGGIAQFGIGDAITKSMNGSIPNSWAWGYITGGGDFIAKAAGNMVEGAVTGYASAIAQGTYGSGTGASALTGAYSGLAGTAFDQLNTNSGNWGITGNQRMSDVAQQTWKNDWPLVVWLTAGAVGMGTF